MADGVRSPLGKLLGREWHRDTVYGVAGRSYVDSDDVRRPVDQLATSSCAARTGEMLSGYGWIFPLGNGEVNIGVGTLATAEAARRRRDQAADGALRRRAARASSGSPASCGCPTSALLPMGGAVSDVAGANWALIGDAAACVNPLNGEGIDYGLETGRLVVELMAEHDDLSRAWPALLREHYGEAFSIARRLAGLVTVPRLLPALGPAGMRSRLADDAGAALDGQPGHRRGPRPRRPGVALGRPALARPATPGRRSAERRPVDCRTVSAGTGHGALGRRARAAALRITSAGPVRSTCRASGPVLLAATPRVLPGLPLPRAGRRPGGRYVRFLSRHDVWNVPRCGRAMDGMRHVPVDREAPAAAYLRGPPAAARGRGRLRLPGGRHLLLVRRPLADARARGAGPRDRGADRAGRRCGAAQRICSVGGPRRPPHRPGRRGRRVDVAFGAPLTVGPGEDLARATDGSGTR